MSYEEKYFKYKKKYFQIKNQFGNGYSDDINQKLKKLKDILSKHKLKIYVYEIYLYMIFNNSLEKIKIKKEKIKDFTNQNEIFKLTYEILNDFIELDNEKQYEIRKQIFEEYDNYQKRLLEKILQEINKNDYEEIINFIDIEDKNKKIKEIAKNSEINKDIYFNIIVLSDIYMCELRNILMENI